MISLIGFLKIFKDTDFKERELKIFYRSVKKSVTLRFFGKRSLSDVFKLEEKCQWPVLQKIDDPGLPIYKGADRELMDKFIKNIEKEKDIRAQRKEMKSASYWSALQSVIEERIGFFKDIFGFCKKDVRHCEMVAERYRRMLERKIENKKKLWKIGIGAGATALAGAAAIWYLSKKEKK